MAANWADLPSDLLVLIAKRVKVIEDYIAFSAVCTSWRSVATKQNFDALYPQVPLLMLAEKDDDYREFYSLTKKNTTRIYLPEARKEECYTIQGWICTVSYDGEMNLLHLFSRTQVQLPPEKALWAALHGYEQDPKPELWLTLGKAVLSASPSVTSDYVLVINSYADEDLLAFWRPGDLNWTKIDVGQVEVQALNYYKEKFYFMTWLRQVWVFDIPGSSIAQPVVQPRKLFKLKDNLYLTPLVNCYLVEVSGALLFIARFLRGNRGHTFNFKVYELDVIKGEWKEINTLGDSAVFLGDGAMSIESSKYKGIKPNYIYFCYDWWEVRSDGRDTGAYNLEDGKFESFYPGLLQSKLSSLTWVTPSLQ